MARQKLGSRILTHAQRRAVNLGTIDPKLDVGGGLTLTRLQSEISVLTDKINRYNAMLAILDGLRSEIKTDEANLSTLCTHLLRGVGCQYGDDS
jgi:hypothetical protein